MKAQIDPLASHIFISCRLYRAVNDNKGGKHREVAGRISYSTASKFGLRGGLDEWERLMGRRRSIKFDELATALPPD